MEHVDVLVVDDEEMVARSIERTLRGHEFKITVANSGVQALQTARRKPPAKFARREEPAPRGSAVTPAATAALC